LRKARRFTVVGVTVGVFSMMVPPSEGRPKADRLLGDPRNAAILRRFLPT
jgi:hypothetical protein